MPGKIYFKRKKDVQKSIQVSGYAADWYNENFETDSQGMSSVIETVYSCLGGHFMNSYFDSTKETLQFMLLAWRELLDRTFDSLKGVFTHDELMFLIRTHKGHVIWPKHFGQNELIDNVIEEIAWLKGHQMLEIEEDKLLEKVIQLNPFEILCLEIWSSGYWHSNEDGISIEQYALLLEEYMDFYSYPSGY